MAKNGKSCPLPQNHKGGRRKGNKGSMGNKKTGY